MYQLFFTPSWFQGYDLVFEGISLIIALLIAGYSLKVYRMSKETKYGYFSFAFLFIALSLALKMFTYGVLYSSPLREATVTILGPAVGQGLEFADLFYRAAFFLQMVVMLGAWLLIFFISQKSRQRLHNFYEVSQMALFVYLIFLISVVSNFKYSVFYLTSAVILGLTVLNYFKNYLSTNCNRNAFLVMVSFMFMLFSNIAFIFVFLWDSMYVVGEVLLLVGFLLLLYTYNRVTKK
ncbi:MAG: hypothetical protein WCV90_05745 [Candidatus Woesearchaeota archaeon]|jgi:hypothetical protein